MIEASVCHGKTGRRKKEEETEWRIIWEDKEGEKEKEENKREDKEEMTEEEKDGRML